MGVEILLDIAVSMYPERSVLGSHDEKLTLEDLDASSRRGASFIISSGVRTVAYLATNGSGFPVAVFSAARAGVPIAPLNYRLAVDSLRELLARLDDPLVICEPDLAESLHEDIGLMVITTAEWLEHSSATAVDPDAGPPHSPVDDASPAVLLFTSGTTSEPKCVILRHEHLLAYVLRTVDPGSAIEDDAALVSVPPYHIAGTATVLSNVYAARRMLYLPTFTPSAWLELVASECISSAMLVPTMLSRIVEYQEQASVPIPSLRSLAYGGARLPPAVLRRALALFPSVDFVNAYGLTETSSTIAVLGPDCHRSALASADPAVQRRISSAGRLVDGVEGQIRDARGDTLGAGEIGELWVRGPQISGEYVGPGSTLDARGWFATRDRGWFDDDGYLFIEGRSDDTIIRGGENIAPAEIEDVVLDHPGVQEVAVLGRPDDEWGERIVAVVAPVTWPGPSSADIQSWTRARLRSSKTPDEVYFRHTLPRTDTGKLLRRVLVAELFGPETTPQP